MAVATVVVVATILHVRVAGGETTRIGSAPTARSMSPRNWVRPMAAQDWSEDGLQVCAAPADQSLPEGAADGSGGAFFVWQDGRSGPDLDVYAARITADGGRAAGWVADGNAVCSASGDQTEPHVVSDGVGGALIAWLDRRDAAQALFVQRLLASGEIAPGWPANGLRLQDSTGSTDHSPGLDMVADGSGGALIAWHDARAPVRRMFVLRISGDGAPAPGWPAGGMNLTWSGNGDDLRHLSSDGSGGAYVAWSQRTIFCLCTLECCPSETSYFLAAHVSSAGMLWRVIGGGPSPGGGGGPLSWTFIGDGQRGAFWGWSRGVTGPFPLERIDFAGSSLWTTSIALGPHWGQSATPDGLGGVFLATHGYVGEDNHDIHAVRISANGELALGWLPNGTRVCEAPGDQLWPLAPVPDGAGAAFFAWTDRRGAEDDLYGTRMSSMGTHAPGWSSAGDPICVAPGVQDQSRMFADGHGNAVIVWRDSRNGNQDIYAQRLSTGVPVPTAISLVRADAEPGVVHLMWFGTEAAGHSARVERRESSSEWAPLATIFADGGGRFALDDRQVRPGGRYGYRLVFARDGREAVTTETWLEIPLDPGFALVGLRPNPAGGNATVSFALPDQTPARLEVLDVNSRIVLAHDVGVLGRGHHVLPVSPDRDLPPGIYLIRLTRDGHRRTIRGVIVH